MFKQGCQSLPKETLEEKLKTTESVIPFTVKYNPSLPEIGRIIHKYWSLLNLSKNNCVKEIFCSSKPTVAFNRPKNLQDFLVSSDLKSNRFAEFKSQGCNSKRCSHCNSIAHSQTFTSTSTGETFTMRHNTNCKSKNVVYLITCSQCQTQYVETRQPVFRRMNSHRFDINNFTDPAFSSLVEAHFNGNNNSIQNFTFMPIGIVKNDMDRLYKETFWIHKLRTENPNGLNNKHLYEV